MAARVRGGACKTREEQSGVCEMEDVTWSKVLNSCVEMPDLAVIRRFSFLKPVYETLISTILRIWSPITEARHSQR